MADIFAIILVGIIIFGASRRVYNKDSNRLLDKEQTLYLKGIAAIVIILHHLANRVNEGYLIYNCEHIGFIIVGLFFFLSGYGLMVQSSRENYFNHFLEKRFSLILIPYAVAMIPYILLKVIYLHNYKTLTECLSQYLRGRFFFENAWYVWLQLFMYVLFYLLFKNSSKNRRRTLMITFAIFIVYMGLFKYIIQWGSWWYNSCLCFCVGLAYPLYEGKIAEFMNKRWKIVALFFIWQILFVLTRTKLAGNQTPIKLLLDNIVCILFCVFVVALCSRYKIGNRITEFLGTISYEIYLLHGLFIILFKECLTISNSFLYTGIVILFSIISAYTLHHILRKPCDLVRNYFESA